MNNTNSFRHHLFVTFLIVCLKLNLYHFRYGAAYKSKTTGILYNSVMDDFSTQGVMNRFGFPPSPANYIKPGKRPMSSMSPFILVDKYGRVNMVLGCSGGPRIITAAVSVSKFIVVAKVFTCWTKFVLPKVFDAFMLIILCINLFNV